jgi:hypothetical protein
MTRMSQDEHTILARFTLPEQAHRALHRLQEAGFETVAVDAIDEAPTDAVAAPQVEWGRYGYEPGRIDDKWTTAAAWDNELGLNWGGGILLTAVVPGDRRAEAERLIEEAGGTL